MIEPQLFSTMTDLRGRVAQWRSDGARIGLVPTMGALHDGHLSLMREAVRRTDKVVVSIFVNPAQFAPREDLDRYPRTMGQDMAKIASSGAAHLVFAPPVAEVYPKGFATKIDVGGPGIGLETDFRPHFFSGVAIVVAKLLIAAMPDIAVFGEKDYQQLLVVRRMAADLGLPVDIVGVPIVREPDGLAMSSRNAYLDPHERLVAGRLNCILKNIAAQVRDGVSVSDAEMRGKEALLEAGFASVDYVAIRDAATLAPLERLSTRARVLAAAKVGDTRLIDNVAV